jgi:hypothetical protein
LTTEDTENTEASKTSVRSVNSVVIFLKYPTQDPL